MLIWALLYPDTLMLASHVSREVASGFYQAWRSVGYHPNRFIVWRIYSTYKKGKQRRAILNDLCIQTISFLKNTLIWLSAYLDAKERHNSSCVCILSCEPASSVLQQRHMHSQYFKRVWWIFLEEYMPFWLSYVSLQNRTIAVINCIRDHSSPIIVC